MDESIVNVLSNNDDLYVPAICLYEVKKKILVDNDAVKTVGAIDIIKKGMVISIDSEIALLASDISKQHKLPMTDSIIYATALCT